MDETTIHFYLTTSTSADITIRSDYGILDDDVIADANFPTSDGKAGNLIRINLNYDSDKIVSSACKRYNMVHELGHCIGLRHTNWQARGEDTAIHISGTPLTDAQSVMNGGTANFTWAGFSQGDIDAVGALYPNNSWVNGTWYNITDESWSGYCPYKIETAVIYINSHVQLKFIKLYQYDSMTHDPTTRIYINPSFSYTYFYITDYERIFFPFDRTSLRYSHSYATPQGSFWHNYDYTH